MCLLCNLSQNYCTPNTILRVLPEELSAHHTFNLNQYPQLLLRHYFRFLHTLKTTPKMMLSFDGLNIPHLM